MEFAKNDMSFNEIALTENRYLSGMPDDPVADLPGLSNSPIGWPIHVIGDSSDFYSAGILHIIPSKNCGPDGKITVYPAYNLLGPFPHNKNTRHNRALVFNKDPIIM